jgi:hypothetical protein
MKSDTDFEDCSYYAEEGEEKGEGVGTEKEVREQSSRSNHKNPNIRSQSVTQK